MRRNKPWAWLQQQKVKKNQIFAQASATRSKHLNIHTFEQEQVSAYVSHDKFYWDKLYDLPIPILGQPR